MEPLYVDVEAGVIRCKWCKQHWKGATEVKVVNQHCKRSAFHKEEKNRVLGIPDISSTTQGVQDIRHFLSC